MKKINVLAICLLSVFFAFSSAYSSDTESSSGVAKIVEKASEMVGEKLDINEATTEMLEKIPGIGPKLGEAITAYRELNGKFSSLQQLLNIDGIDEGLLDKISPYLKL